MRGDQPQDGEAERRLAGAGFADDAERLAGAQLQRQPVDRLDVIDGALQQPALDREPDLEIVGLDDDRAATLAAGGSPLGSAASRWLRIGVLAAS